MQGAHSIAAVLHGRLEKADPPARGQTQTFAERVPGGAAPEITEAYRAADATQAEIGRQLAARPEEWAVRAWGMPRAEPGPVREDWERRAGLVGAYRQAAGITNPDQAIGPVPSGKGILREMFGASIRALELPDDQALLKAMGNEELEVTLLRRERAVAVAPPEVSAQLASVERQRDVAVRQAETAAEAGDHHLAGSAGALVQMHDGQLASLRVADAAHREWAEAHAPLEAEAQAAERELRERDLAGRLPETAAAESEPQAQPETDTEFHARLDRMVAEAEGREWVPPEPEAEPEPQPRPLPEAEFEEQLDRMVAKSEGREYVPPPREPEPEPEPEPLHEAEFWAQLDQIVRDSQREPEAEAEPAPDDRAAMYAEIHEDLAAVGDGIRELSARMDDEDARRAEARRESLGRPAAWQQPQAQAEADLEPSWQAGEVREEAEASAEMDFEAEM
jgi:hypothetical protein